ncbi:helix-turn-helix transcriptional regulator [Aminobacter anthyllidis]|uniref:helix-turn-helix transcriptional regulator n=1 Tax=Aminobacter anthyllidis TaxID=1035067 RepID=UPI0024540E9C|nr:helix-turn-helix transcriptional regulator [Aminobacter anthyllidis]MDH4988405.1 helix-turn-helix transcriptional regulator [Aminobacter anthyllidis]
MQRLSTLDVPARDRLAYLHDFVARHVAGLRFRPEDADSFAFNLSAYFLDGRTTVGTACYSAVFGERPKDLLAADGRQDYLLTIHTSDYEVAMEGKSPLIIKAGDITLVNEGSAMAFALPATLLKVVSLEEARLAALAPRVRTRALHHISASAAGANLLTGYADLLRAAAPDGEAGRRLAGSHLYDLAALVIQGGSADTAEQVRPSLGAARLELVKAEIFRQLTDPELSVTAIARRQGITPRYIQRLFEQEGLTFSEFLRDARLDLARKSLDAPGAATVSAIAFDAGFNDLSHFNRVFRQRFGATPTEIKAAALRRCQ